MHTHSPSFITLVQCPNIRHIGRTGSSELYVKYHNDVYAPFALLEIVDIFELERIDVTASIVNPRGVFKTPRTHQLNYLKKKIHQYAQSEHGQ